MAQHLPEGFSQMWGPLLAATSQKPCINWFITCQLFLKGFGLPFALKKTVFVIIIIIDDDDNNDDEDDDNDNDDDDDDDDGT